MTARIARANLRQSLYQLRKVLHDNEQEQPFLRVTRHTVQFDQASDYTLDIHRFLTAVEAGDWATAVSHYPGDLLPGFTCDSLEFEEWLRGERERLHWLALDAMIALAARHLRNGRIQEAQAIARRQLTLVPWSETAHRQLMEALALAGNRAAALAQFEQCRAVLAAELGVPPSPETVALADALTRAHRLHILHRDLKPANVLLDENSLPRLTDFGVARLGPSSQLTEQGAVLGTFAYLSPEACLGEIVDERADIWVLYEMLLGQRPFATAKETAGASAVIAHILNDSLPDIRQGRPDIPEALEDLLYRLLAKNRADRIPSVRLVGAELEAILRDAPTPATAGDRQPRPDAARRATFATATPERLRRLWPNNMTTR